MAAPLPIEPTRRPRVALYSHDAQGLGHMRRNLAIADALTRAKTAPDILVVTGAAEAVAVERPRHCDVITLPALRKDREGSYAPRHLSGSLGDLIALRSAVLASALEAFAPDLLIVDKLPGGAFGELVPALERLRAARRTRMVLGLRDVLDEPATTCREWREQEAVATIERFFDALWVYGDPRILDPVAEYALPPGVAARVVYTGYLARGRRPGAPAPAFDHPFVLGIVGGGQDGLRLAECFAAAPLPAAHRGVLVCGPHMPPAHRARVDALAAARDDLAVHGFVAGLERWVAKAAAVVSMGGYNTVCEVLAAATPCLVVPRVRPRVEQLIRARRLAARGALEYLHPDALDPTALGAWLSRAAGRRRRELGALVDLEGLARLPALAERLLAAPGREAVRAAA